MDLMAMAMALKARKMNAAEFQAAVEQYLEDNPGAVDQAAIEALFADQLDAIEAEQGVLKSAIDGNMNLDLTDIYSGFINKPTVGSAIAFKSSSITTTIKKIIGVKQGYHYRIAITDSASPAATRSRDCAITDSNNIIRQIFAFTNAASTTTVIDLVSAVDGYLYLGVDSNYTSIKINGGGVYENAIAIEQLAESVSYDIGESINPTWADGALTTNGAIGSTVDISTVTTTAGWTYAIINVAPGEVYTLNAGGGSSPRTWCITDAEYTILNNSDVGAVLENGEITMPTGAAYLIINNNASKQADPTIVKGRIIQNRIEDINHTLSTVLGGSLVKTKKDTVTWAVNRLSQTGTPADAQSRYLLRRGHISDTILGMSAPTDCLRAAAYDFSTGAFKGVWDANEKTLRTVSQTSDAKTKHLDFEMLRAKYPGYDWIVECDDSANPLYPAANIDIHYIRYEDRDVSATEYMHIPTNSGGWHSVGLSHTTGEINRSSTKMTMLDFVPEYWSRIEGNLMEVHIYDASGTWLGMLGMDDIATGGNLWETNDVDFEKLRKRYPGYKFKIVMYCDTLDMSNVGTITINKKLYDQWIVERNSYKIPNRFSREQFFAYTTEWDRAVTSQGMCTDGEYFYTAEVKLDTSGERTHILKINMEGELVANNDLGAIGHSSELAYDPNNHLIYSVGRDGSLVQVIDPDTLALGEPLDLSNVMTAINEKAVTPITGFWSIAYWEKYNVFIVGSSTVAIVSADFTKVYKVLNVEHGIGMIQFVYPMDDYIIFGFVNEDYSVWVYDVNGKTITAFNPQRLQGSGYSELEAICVHNGRLYTHWNTSTSNRTAITVGDPVGFAVVPIAEVEKKFNHLN